NEYVVTNHSMNGGRVTTPGELEEAGLLADLPKVELPADFKLGSKPGPMPNYQTCLDRARKRKDGQPDRSAADAMFVKLALLWGRPEKDIEVGLGNVSEKAKERRNG